MLNGFNYYTNGDYIRPMVIVNTCQHKSTLVNGYRQNAASMLRRAWKRAENGVRWRV